MSPGKEDLGLIKGSEDDKERTKRYFETNLATHGGEEKRLKREQKGRVGPMSEKRAGTGPRPVPTAFRDSGWAELPGERYSRQSTGRIPTDLRPRLAGDGAAPTKPSDSVLPRGFPLFREEGEFKRTKVHTNSL